MNKLQKDLNYNRGYLLIKAELFNDTDYKKTKT